MMNQALGGEQAGGSWGEEGHSCVCVCGGDDERIIQKDNMGLF